MGGLRFGAVWPHFGAQLVLPFVVACASGAGPVSGSAVLEAKSSPVLVIHNARVYGHPEATAVQIVGDKITKIGGEALLADLAGRTLDADGGLVLPGFHDAHIHMLGGGLSLSRAQIGEAKTLAETLRIIKAWADAHPDAPWVRGRGWSYDIVGKGSFPTAAMLDAILPDRPVAVDAYDGHTLWVNTKAMTLAGIGKTTPPPAGGTIVKDAAGNPTGALLEDAASLVDAVVPSPTRAEKKEALLAACAHVSALGVSAVDAIEADPEELDLFGELEREGKLPIRVRVYLPIEGDHDAYADLKKSDTERVQLVGVKGFVDGVVESKTAFMLAPYKGSNEKGTPILPREKLLPLVDSAHARGLQVLLHSIGDAAVRLSLDAFEAAQRAHPERRLRHRVEHIEVIDPADLGRLATVGAVASMQPYHAVPYEPDPDAGAWSENLGEERRRMSFAWRMLQDAKAPITFGSDWPVYTASPLAGLAVALTRQNDNGFPKDGWNGRQKLDLGAALHAYGVERGQPDGPSSTVGHIEPGQLADLVVLGKGASLDAPLTLFRAKVQAVIVGGARVH